MLLLASAALASPLYISPKVLGVDDAATASGIAEVAISQLRASLGEGGVEPAESTRSYVAACATFRCDQVVEITVYRIYDRYYAHALALAPDGATLGDYDGTSKDIDGLGVLLGSLARAVEAGHPVSKDVSVHRGQPGEIGHLAPPRAPPPPPDVPDSIAGFSFTLVEPFGDNAISPGFNAAFELRAEKKVWFLDFDSGILVIPTAWYGCGGGGVNANLGAGWFIVQKGDIAPYLVGRGGLRIESAGCNVGAGVGGNLGAGVEILRRTKSRLWIEARIGADLLTAGASWGYGGLNVGAGF